MLNRFWHNKIIFYLNFHLFHYRIYSRYFFSGTITKDAASIMLKYDRKLFYRMARIRVWIFKYILFHVFFLVNKICLCNIQIQLPHFVFLFFKDTSTF